MKNKNDEEVCKTYIELTQPRPRSIFASGQLSVLEL